MAASVTTYKWFLNSKRIIGTIIAAAGVVFPAVGPLVGVHITASDVATFGADATSVLSTVASAADAIITLGGFCVAFYGAWKAQHPLTVNKADVGTPVPVSSPSPSPSK